MIVQNNKLNVKMKTNYWLLKNIINIFLFNHIIKILKKIKVNTFIKKRNNDKKFNIINFRVSRFFP